VTGLLTISAVSNRATLPITTLSDNGYLLVSKLLQQTTYSSVAVGDQILSLDGVPVYSPEAMEFLCETKSIGAMSSVEVERGGQTLRVSIELIPFYPTPRLQLVLIFLGTILFGLAMFLQTRLAENYAAAAFHWTVVLLMTTFLFSQGRIDTTDWHSIARRVVLLTAYPLSGAFLLFFVLNFPKTLETKQRRLAFLVFLPMAVVVSLLCASFQNAITVHDESSIAQFLSRYRLFQIAFLAYVIGSVGRLLYSYLRTESKESKTKLQWVLWGIGIAPIPFLFFVLLPDIFLGFDLIPEEMALISLVVAPFAMTIAIVRHNLFDIEVLVNRSVVYALFTAVVGAVYVLLLLLLTSTFAVENAKQTVGVVLITATFALALNPLRVKLQEFVDEQLFPAKIEFRSRLSSTLDSLRKAPTQDAFFQRLRVELSSVFAPHTVLCMRHSGPQAVVMVFPSDRRDKIVPLNDSIVEEFFLNDRVTERTISMWHRNQPTRLHRWMELQGFDACVPVISESNSLLALLALSFKGPPSPLAREEILLLESFARETSEMLARFALQAEYLREHEERLRVETVNKTASDFISTVSHELQTPLTSVSMFAELLRSHKHHPIPKRAEFLSIIEGESRRLSRLINNLLDYSRVERGVREFNFQETDFASVVHRALNAMQYSFEKEKATVSVRVPKKIPMTSADPDALEEMLINLLSNALKYSPGSKNIKLRVTLKNQDILCSVADRGMGIPKDSLDKIFDRHYRVTNLQKRRVGGLGIGLSLVQHTVTAHGGTISVESQPGKGSTFFITIPLQRNHQGEP